MAGFDDPGVYYSEPFFSEEVSEEGEVSRTAAVRRFKEFIKTFLDNDNVYCYREQLKRRYNLGQYKLQVAMEDLGSFDAQLSDHLTRLPAEYLPLFEDAAKEAADELTRPRPEGEELHNMQVLLQSDANPLQIRDLRSEHMARLVKVPGIVIQASGLRAKATRLTLQCRSCRHIIPSVPVRPGLEGFSLPRRCPADQTGRPKCALDSFFVVPDKCKCVDFQVLKLQESPDSVPKGELPRHLQLYLDRYLTDCIVPGNRITVMGIYSIRKSGSKPQKGPKEKASSAGLRRPYLRVVGIEVDSDGPGRASGQPLTSEEEEELRRLASRPDIYEVVARSISPSIYGSMDIKKAIACLLIGGSRKRLPDGLTRRGDINLLLLGDPGTAKSQLLKFVEKVAPIGVYTSGKGSSAAGLTASVMRDPVSRNFIMEGGAMVLADGGVVCIDEFDKMRSGDRVAIHEAMEQQTISIAKAGITTTLNSRCSVLAAANSVFGRWDESKGDANIDFLPTILSRFDMIFIIKDEHNIAKDTRLAKHVMQVHLNALQPTAAVGGEEEVGEGELALSTLKKFITFCRRRCGPRMSEQAADKLRNRYVVMRGGARQHERDTAKKTSIPITVRQLEAIIRISESLAKMSLLPFALESHVDEALRLFQVSTMDAALSGSLSGAEGFASEVEQEEVRKVERQLKNRFPIGSHVSEQRVVQDFLKQNYTEQAILTVIHIMLRRGELQHRMQRKVLFRIR